MLLELKKSQYLAKTDGSKSNTPSGRARKSQDLYIAAHGVLKTDVE